MSSVKNVIGILCKHLNLLLETNFKAEQFRLAKFNKNNNNLVNILSIFFFYLIIKFIPFILFQTEEFWKILYMLLKDNYRFAFIKNGNIFYLLCLKFCSSID